MPIYPGDAVLKQHFDDCFPNTEIEKPDSRAFQRFSGPDLPAGTNGWTLARRRQICFLKVRIKNPIVPNSQVFVRILIEISWKAPEIQYH
jgi:hypothetical protein